MSITTNERYAQSPTDRLTIADDGVEGAQLVCLWQDVDVGRQMAVLGQHEAKLVPGK